MKALESSGHKDKVMIGTDVAASELAALIMHGKHGARAKGNMHVLITLEAAAGHWRRHRQTKGLGNHFRHISRIQVASYASASDSLLIY